MAEIKNPKLFKQVSVDEYNSNNPAGMRVRDLNENGVVDEGDAFCQTIDGVERSIDPRRALDDLCKNRLDHDTRYKTSKRAQKTLDRHFVSLTRRDDNTRYWGDGSGWEETSALMSDGQYRLIGSTIGKFDRDLNGFNYIKRNVRITAGRNDHEVKLVYTDATGRHRHYLNLDTGVVADAK